MPKNFEQLAWEEFWILPTIGNAYPNLRTKGRFTFAIVNYVVAYTWQIGIMALLVYTNILIKDRISLLSQTSHFLIVGAVSMTASVTLSLSRKKLDQFQDLLGHPEGFAPYVKSAYFDGLKRQTTNKKNYYIKFWILMYGSCGLVGVAQPLIDSLASRKFNETVVNGVWINLPVALWVPLDLENTPTAWYLVFMAESLYLFYCAIQVTCAIVLCFTASDRILDQLKSCLWAISHLDARANKMLRQKYPFGEIKEMKNEFDRCYYDCVVQNVKHHLVIKKEFEKFIDLASFPIAVPFFGGAMLLGMALITVTAEDDPRIGPKCLALMMATSEAINMFNLCKVGQEFQELSNEIFEALFYAKWYKRSAKCKRAICIMRLGFTNPLQLTATRFLTLKMEVFSDLVNSAYSIFNLMNASKS